MGVTLQKDLWVMCFNTAFSTGLSEQDVITLKPIPWHLFRNLLIVQSEAGVLRERNIAVVGEQEFPVERSERVLDHWGHFLQPPWAYGRSPDITFSPLCSSLTCLLTWPQARGWRLQGKAALVHVGSLVLSLFQRITFLSCHPCLSSIHRGPMMFDGNG